MFFFIYFFESHCTIPVVSIFFWCLFVHFSSAHSVSLTYLPLVSRIASLARILVYLQERRLVWPVENNHPYTAPF